MRNSDVVCGPVFDESESPRPAENKDIIWNAIESLRTQYKLADTDRNADTIIAFLNDRNVLLDLRNLEMAIRVLIARNRLELTDAI